MEEAFDKKHILYLYMNQIYLGSGAYGIEAAARTYFDKPATELDLAESALLAGLIQAPSRLDPFHHPDAAKTRRNEILARMAYAHPLQDHASVAAQARRAEINGVDRIWYAGAYWGYGFHEDGLRSGVEVAQALGVAW